MKKREERGVCCAFQRGDCTRGAGCKISDDEQNMAWGLRCQNKEMSTALVYFYLRFSQVEDLLMKCSMTMEIFTVLSNRPALPDRAMDVVDQSALFEEEPGDLTDKIYWESGFKTKIGECLVSLLGIGVVCSEEAPETRIMTAGKVVADLCFN